MMETMEATMKIDEIAPRFVNWRNTNNAGKLRAWLADHPEKTNRKGEPLKSNVTDNDSATMKTSHGVVQGYTGVAAVDARAQIVVHAGAYGTGQENGLLPDVLHALRSEFDAMGRADPLAAATVPWSPSPVASALRTSRRRSPR